MYCFWTSQYYFTKLNAFLLFSACDNHNPTFMRGKLTDVSRGQWHWGTVIVLDFLLDLSTVSDFCVEKTSRMTGTEGMESCLSFIMYGFIQEQLATNILQIKLYADR